MTEARRILSSGAKRLGIKLSSAHLDLFDTFTTLLLEWNAKFNLTRITDPAEIAIKHYLDSLSLLAFVDIPTGFRVIDVGTGAGFPGVPLKIARPDLEITLLDSVRKKLTFLESALECLGLSDVHLVHGRAEDLGKAESYREKFDLVVSRAVGRLNVLAELCLPFCRVGGLFVAYKGAKSTQAEAEEASNAVNILGGKLEAVHEFVLPEGNLQRSLVVIIKKKPTPVQYPRKAGVPERNPLQALSGRGQKLWQGYGSL